MSRLKDHAPYCLPDTSTFPCTIYSISTFTGTLHHHDVMVKSHDATVMLQDAMTNNSYIMPIS